MNDLNSQGSKRQLPKDPASDLLSQVTPDVKISLGVHEQREDPFDFN